MVSKGLVVEDVDANVVVEAGLDIPVGFGSVEDGKGHEED